MDHTYLTCEHVDTHAFMQFSCHDFAPHILLLLLLSVPSMVSLGEIKLHIGVDYGKKAQAVRNKTHTHTQGQVAVTLLSAPVCDKASHPAFCVHTGRLRISSPPDDSRENYRESICQTMRLLLRE